jgi:hypothetical protein
MGWTLHEQAEEEAEAPGVLSCLWSSIVASGTAFCGRYCTNLFLVVGDKKVFLSGFWIGTAGF